MDQCRLLLQRSHEARVQQEKVPEQYNELKRLYFNWRDGQTHTGLGRAPLTGEVTADPEWYGASPGVLTTRISLTIF